MIARSILTSCLLASVCFISACKNATKRSYTALGTNRFDIALEGPWILYQDSQFDAQGKKIAVLIAIAPDAATSEPLAKGDDLHHHAAQVSTGDGYVLTIPAIYCLTLDEKCAPEGPASLTYDGYPQAVPLPVAFHNATDTSAIWNWVSKRGSNTTLILPMPDSYSNDGVWHMRFGSDFSPDGKQYTGDTLHSIGLILHYASGPSSFGLLSCDEKQPSAANCKNPPKIPKSTKLENTGTLRIEMRAPDIADACDRHVRFAYHEAYKLVSNDYAKDIAFIEPAQAVAADGTATYENSLNHSCLDKDPQGHPLSGSLSTQNARAAATSGNSTVLAMPMGATVSTMLSTVIRDIKSIKLKHDTNPDILSADSSAEAAKKLTEALDPQFPRISQLLLIGQLLRASENAIRGFEADSDNKLTGEEREKIERLETNFEQLEAFAPKNGNDCRAAVMLIGP